MSSLTADHCFWCSGGVPCCFEGVPGYYGMFRRCSGVVPGCSGLFRAVPGVFQGCSGVFRGCSGVLRGVPGFTDTRNHLQHTRIAVALARANFLLFFGLKTKENSHALKRQLYMYAANDSTLSV